MKLVNNKKVERLLAVAKSSLLINSPFFAQIILSVKFGITEEVSTLTTDGKWILVNPVFTSKISSGELVGILVHEAMHIIGKHHLRQETRTDKKWNYACDYAINPLILTEGFTLPENALSAKNFEGKSAEAIYTELKEIDLDDDAPAGEVLPYGSFDEGGTLSKEAYGLESARVSSLTARAAAQARLEGKLPGALLRLVEALLKSTTPWEEMLRKYMVVKAKSDYSWSSPNRRHISSGIYLPGIKSEDGMGPVCIGVDVSGSITKEELGVFASEVKAILEDARPSEVTVIYFDSEVRHVDVFTSPRNIEISLKAVGGGGTDFRPVFQYICEEVEEAPDVVVILTDLYGPTPSEEYCPTIWACLPNSSSSTPFGERVDIEV